MVVPPIARDVAACAGALLVLVAAASEIGTLIVPRPVANWLTKQVDRAVDRTYLLLTKPIQDYKRRDRVLAPQAATLLI